MNFNSLLTAKTARMTLGALFLSAWLCPSERSYGQSASTAPWTLAELAAAASQIEAQKPTEELVAELESRWCEFEPTDKNLTQVTAAAKKGHRPEDSVRRIADTARACYVVDRFAGLLRAQKPEEPIQAHLNRGAIARYSTETEEFFAKAGASERVLRMLFAPTMPDPVRHKYQVWRKAEGIAVKNPEDFSSSWGEVKGRVTIDGRVMLLFKDTSVFYNVFCGQDMSVDEIEFSRPLPRLDPSQWDYSVQPLAKGDGRGKVFACPFDARCKASNPDRPVKDAHCRWDDIEAETDERGFRNVRIVVDDDRKGKERYRFVLKWALRPYNLPQLQADFKKYGWPAMKDRIFRRGTQANLGPGWKETLRSQGANDDLIREVEGNVRGSNWR